MHTSTRPLLPLLTALALLPGVLACDVDESDYALDVDEDFLVEALEGPDQVEAQLPEPASVPAAAEPEDCAQIPVHCQANGQTYDSQCDADADGQPAELELVVRGDFGSLLDPIDPNDPPFFNDAPFHHDTVLDDDGDWDVTHVYTANNRTIYDRGSLENELGGEYLVVRAAAGFPGQKDFWCQQVTLQPGAEYNFDMSGVSFRNEGNEYPSVSARFIGEPDAFFQTGDMSAPDGWVDYSTSFTYEGSATVVDFCLRQNHDPTPWKIIGVDSLSLRQVNCTPALSGP